MARGKYIVIEGSDGTGKSLQAIRLSNYLESQGISVLRTFNDETGEMEPIQEPGGTPTADKIRQKIKDNTIQRTPWENVEWFTEARQSIWQEAINPALQNGTWVVASRSWISTMAYQGYGEGVDLDQIRRYTLDHVGEQYMHPDCVFILALEDEVQRLERIKNAGRARDSALDTFESKPDDFQKKMQSGYVQFAKDNAIQLTDASRSIDEVFDVIRRQVEKLL